MYVDETYYNDVFKGGAGRICRLPNFMSASRRNH